MILAIALLIFGVTQLTGNRAAAEPTTEFVPQVTIFAPGGAPQGHHNAHLPNLPNLPNLPMAMRLPHLPHPRL